MCRTYNKIKNIIIRVLMINFIISFVYAHAAPFAVDVFTLTKLPIQKSFSTHSLPKNTKLNIYYLDQLNLFNRFPNEKISRIYQLEGSDAALNEAKKQIFDKKVVYQHIAEGLNKTLLFHITKIPAIVFDGKYEILGTIDISKAYSRYTAI